MLNKRITALLMIVFISLITFPVPLKAQEGNLFINGDFEASSGTSPTGWHNFHKDFTDTSYMTYESGLGYENSKCVKIVANTAVYQKATVFEGDEYTLGLKSKTLALSDTTMRVDIFFYNSSNSIITSYSIRVWVSSEWEDFSQSFHAPEGTTSAIFYFYKAWGSLVYFDNASLVRSGGRTQFELTTDEVFYYSDRTGDGIAAVEANLVHFPGLSSSKVDFYFKDGSYTVNSKTNVAFQEGKACYTYPMSYFAENEKEYTLLAVVKDAGGSEIIRLSQSLFKYDRPAKISSDGIYLKDGEPFNPVFAYHVNVNDYKYCAEAGINVVELSYWYCDYLADPGRIDRVLAELEKYNLMGMVSLYRNMIPAGHDYNIENTKRIVSRLKGNPYVFAYSVMDEPMHNNKINPEDDLFIAYKTIRDIDSDTPIYLVENIGNEKQLKKAEKYCDIFAVDPYPAGNGAKENYVLRRIKNAMELANGVKPVYSLIQTFDWREYFPTADDIRHMVYQSFAAGAKGIGYFCIENAAETQNLYETDRWPGLKAFAEDELDFIFDAFVNKKYNEVYSYEDENILYRGWETDNYIKMIALNLESNNNSFLLSFDNYGYNIETIAGDNSNAAERVLNSFEFDLSPGQAIVYSIKHAAMQNEGFEEGMSGWTASRDDYVKTVNDGANGERSLGITKADGIEAYASQCFTLHAGRTYRLSFMFKSSGKAGPVIELNGIKQILSPPESGVWSEYSVLFSLPEGETVLSNTLLKLLNETSGTSVYYDDFSVTEAEVEDGILFYKNGAEITSLEAGKIIISCAAVPRQEGDYKLVAALSSRAGNSTKVDAVYVSKGIYISNCTPVELSMEIEIPVMFEDNYLKVFLIDLAKVNSIMTENLEQD